MEKENKLTPSINESIIATNKSVKESNEAIMANANRQIEILESQTNLYRNTLLLIGVNLIIGFGILILAFISYSDKQEIATLNVQLRSREDEIRTLQLQQKHKQKTTDSLTTVIADEKK
jgi:hypothetical protein